MAIKRFASWVNHNMTILSGIFIVEEGNISVTEGVSGTYELIPSFFASAVKL